ncbi:hypothetical protein [Weissella confusa]|uniref:aggregation-promoting factor C-terminal-like domain-containing protein n=1 Tax=Weissella confusa TaxID=1583 RepID=UPI00107FD08A|nr:hypothetical protein [Weissella confusa]MEE0002611.1 hypothetical protein [Weissella confusa]TGE64352.1 hypothetical protein C6P12_07015 [Weissella confusa]
MKKMSRTAILTALALASFGATTVIIQSDVMPNAQVSANVANGYSNGLYYTNGSLANGYINDGQNWYLFKDGQKLSEIQQYMGGYYYFDKTTHLRTNNAFRDEWGNTYYFGGDGRAVTGLQTINGNKYYFGDDGTYTLRKSQWLTIGGAKYYATADGSFASDVTKIGNTYYYFDPSTYLKVTNTTVNINGVDWYFDGSGVGTKKASSANQGSVYDQFIAAGGTDAMWKYIVMHESGGNPNAVSPNGYRGLGQTKQSWGTGTVAQQTAGMINYAVTRYGSIDNAIKFRQANGWW